jgi:hypothetical protein
MKKISNLFELAETQLIKEKRQGKIPCYTISDVIDYAIKIRRFLDNNPNRIKKIMKLSKQELVKHHREAVKRYSLKKEKKMTKQELYDFYLENCVDKDKGEIPLNYKEWEREIYPEDLKFLNKFNKGIK